MQNEPSNTCSCMENFLFEQISSRNMARIVVKDNGAISKQIVQIRASFDMIDQNQNKNCLNSL